jgi:hypothetical protein
VVVPVMDQEVAALAATASVIPETAALAADPM